MDTKCKLRAAQAGYKSNFDKSLRRKNEEINRDGQVYLPVDKKSDKETRDKLSSIVEGPFLVTKIEFSRRASFWNVPIAPSRIHLATALS